MGLPKPYGGILVQRVLNDRTRGRVLDAAGEMLCLKPDYGSALDAEKIAIGAYSPLEGFIGQEDYLSVIHKGELANGLPWTIPIIFAPSGKENMEVVDKADQGDDLLLLSPSKEPFAVFHVEEKFTYDKKELAKAIYGTTSPEHPNVECLYQNGNILLSGKIDLIERLKLPYIKYELTPSESRNFFNELGWQTIAAYQTRNPPHMAHEYIQRCALEIVDGLFIHPIIGKLKKDDFPPKAIIEAYEYLIDNYYSNDRVVLATLSLAMRYAGPKAAVFLAIIRRNYGCTHFIIGRDMAGVSGRYDPYGAHRLFQEIDLGIEPILFRESFYCKRCRLIASDKTCGHELENRLRVSMTGIREMLKHGKEPPAEMMRPEISKILKKYL